jgi:hypothetical protein
MAGSANRIIAGGNAFAVWTVDDTVTTPTVGASPALYLYGNIINTDVARQDSGAYNITIEHVEDNQALQDFIETSISVSGNVEDILREDGVTETSGANTKYIAAVKGGTNGASDKSARKVGVFPVRLSNTSGGWTQAGETYNRVTLEFEGYKLSAPVTLLATHLTSFMTTATPVTLTTSKPYGTVVYG